MNQFIRKIMVYIDGTEQSITAAQYAICLASSLNAELVACFVINTKAIENLLKSHIFLEDEQAEYQRDMETDAERYLNYVHELGAKKGLAVMKRTCKGSVHEEVLDTVKNDRIDLLVIGELARVRSRRDGFYDESERAMRTVPCSVLIVKDEDYVTEMYEALI